MIITLSIFYYLFLAVVFIFCLYTLFNLYHLLRFGFFSLANVAVMIAYLVISGALLFFSFNFLSLFDWQIILLKLDLGFFSNLFNFIKL